MDTLFKTAESDGHAVSKTQCPSGGKPRFAETSDFKRALRFVLKWEGGYVNNPNDKGGATNYGVTQNTYNRWRKCNRAAAKDVRNITMPEIEDIYYNNYWHEAKCNAMSPVFAVLAFDTAVNMGVGRVEEFLRVAKWRDPSAFIAARRAKYEEFAKYGNQKIFLKGWLNRLNDLEKFVKTV